MSGSATQALTGKLPGIATGPLRGSPLLRDYLAGEPRAAAFFTGHPADPAAYRRKAAEVDARLDPASRNRLAGAFRPLSPAANAKLERVLAGEGYFVTTGQQTGLFTGPLYTIYKALSAIRLAAALEPALQRPVLALFWSAADDHDWDEVNHATVLDAAGYPQLIALGTDASGPPFAMSHRQLDTSAQLAVDALRDALQPTAFRDRYLAQLRAAYTPGRSMADAFEDTLATVLEGQELALVSSAHPLVKQHAVPVLATALRHATLEEAQVAAQTERLLSAGYHAQVSVAPGASNVFLQDEQGRDRLVRDGGGWLLRRTRRTIETDVLVHRLQAEPAAFSPNVLLRPVVESSLFPTVAYVGGPAETSYFAQIGCLFRLHGIMPPLVFPRHSVTLVESGVARVLDKFGLDLTQLQQPVEEVIVQLLRRELPPAVTESVKRLRSGIAQGYDALAQAAEPIAPGAAGPLNGARKQALAQVAAMEKKVLQQVRREQAVRFEQLRRAAGNLYPGDSPQERTLNIFPFLVRYGPELLPAILAELVVEVAESHTAFSGVNCSGDALAPISVRGIA